MVSYPSPDYDHIAATAAAAAATTATDADYSKQKNSLFLLPDVDSRSLSPGIWWSTAKYTTPSFDLSLILQLSNRQTRISTIYASELGQD
jgi:hypothetical protein